MSSLQQWRDERATTLTTAKDIVAKAKAAGRDLTASEQEALTRSTDRIKQIDSQIAGKALVDSVMSLGSVEDFDGDGNPRGHLFTEETKAAFTTAIKTRSAYRAEVARKALTVGSLLPPSGTGVEAGIYPNLYPLAELFRTEPASGPVQRFYRFGAATAEIVAEGAPKPDSGSTVTGIDVPLVKIATTSKVSDELSQDASFLVGYLQAELTSAVVSAENAEIVDSFTTSGINTDSGAAADVIDLVGAAIATQEGTTGTTPTAVILNPVTLGNIRAMKASTSGTYHVDPWTAGPPTLHGLRLASTPAVAMDKVWVVSGQAVVIYRRGPVQVETGLDGSDFTSNLRTIRCEERLASAVVRPSGLTELTLT